MLKPSSIALLAVAATLGLTGCARGSKSGPEAHLGNGPNRLGQYDGGRGDPRGHNQERRGSAQEFQSGGSDIVYFTSDSSDLTPEARQTLAAQAQWLARHQNHTITIEGHADERGTREYNIGLGARRATATRDFLVQQGVSPARIRTTSYGKERPIAVCNDISCWSQNRRSQTVLGAAPVLSAAPGGRS